MNTLKKSSIAILSLGLLLSMPVQAGFRELYKQAGQAAQNLWAKRSAVTNALPAMPSINMSALSAASLPKISMPSMPKIYMPTVSREQVEAGFDTLGKCMQKAENVMAQYPTTVAATKMAAKVVPVVIIGGCLVKKAYDKYNQVKKESMLSPEEARKELIAQLDKDLIGGGMITAVKVLQDTQAYIKDVTDRKEEKVPGALHFERDLGRYIDIFPNFLGEINKEWNTFVRLAIAHDNAKDNRFAEDLLASFDRLINQLHEVNALFLHENVDQSNNKLEQANNVESVQAAAEPYNEILVKRVIGG